jgi:hypothetical protein
MMLNYLQSKQKFGLFVLCVSLSSLVGCASGYREKFSTQDVIHFKVDCQIKDQQLAYLTSIKRSKSETQLAAFEVATLGPLFTKDYEYKKSLSQQNVNWWIDNVIDEVSLCPDY